MRASTAGRALALVLGLAPAHVFAFPDGAPPGHTGGFGEPTCAACHFQDEGRETPGGLSLEGIAESYEAGATYALELRLQPGAMRVGGVQLSARFADGPEEGAAAGTLEPLDALLAVVTLGDTDYLTFNAMARGGNGADIRWRFQWTAPDSAAAVAMHAAAVAGNDDESPLGDAVHKLERFLDAQ